MEVSTLCIVQARYNSTRLPGKMLLKLGNETLIERAHRMALQVFGRSDVVVAIPKGDEAGPLGDELRRIRADVFAWDGLESDVLGRFHACAHAYRWHPGALLYRWTPDDWDRKAYAIHQVLHGRRLPVELGGEAFTLAMLDAAHERCTLPSQREHITFALFPTLPPPPSAGVWTIDTRADYEAACAMLEQAA